MPMFLKGMRKINTTKSKKLKLSKVFTLGAAISAGGTGTIMSAAPAFADTTVTVKPGQSLNSIATDNHISVDTLAKKNNLTVSSTIHPNQQLTVPDTTPTTHVVKKGETISEIAKAHNLKTEDVLKLNNLTWEHSTIWIGQTIKLTDGQKDQNTTQQNQGQIHQSQTQQQTTNQASQASLNIQGTDTSSKAVNLALQLTKMNIPYVWGGESTSGMDCSGLVKYVYGQLGYSLPHYTVSQESYVNKVNTPTAASVVATAKPGDLLFWGSQGASYHVAIYIGNGKYVAAPTFGQNVSVGSVYSFTPQFVGSLR